MFGFKNIEKTDDFKYKKNFIRTVVFQIGYAENKECLNKKNDVISLFETKFPRINNSKSQQISITFSKEQTPILQTSDKANEGFEMRSSDGQKIISINKQFFSYTISGKVYINFQNTIKDFNSINPFFKLCNINTLNRIAIRKINIIEFKITNDDNPTEIYEYLINQELLSNFSYFPNSKYIKQNIQNISYQNQDDRLNIKYGLILPPDKRKIGQIVIDIDLFTLSNISIDKLIDKFTEINQEIFNIFNWAISEKALILLNE